MPIVLRKVGHQKSITKSLISLTKMKFQRLMNGSLINLENWRPVKSEKQAKVRDELRQIKRSMNTRDVYLLKMLFLIMVVEVLSLVVNYY